ncbi:hypothetical protein QBC35DRAFT_518985 [Podospora australis]|uniref:DUF3669 domain-containing protein n=1 Tax=Podospora australis TaxID=1536484 RepID=A0AAN7AB54_9PEZI|nr:hypothetical protein QBC35DRAFT_518985 [Podospora australis]
MSSRKYLKATDLAQLSAVDILQRCLNVETVVSTKSSFMQRSHLAVRYPDLQHIVEIGAGMQALSTNLVHEYSLHQAVVRAFDRYDGSVNSGVRVPRLFNIIRDTDEDFGTHNLDKFPTSYRTRGHMVTMDRILPLPKIVRKALISHFYARDGDVLPDPGAIDAILDIPQNKHCLVRTYLGRDTGVLTKHGFSLRNFPLFLKPMQELGLDVMGLASTMGKAFAIMHWGAGVNGDDVEFVLGSSVIQGTGVEALRLDVQQRAIGFYLLDFGQCYVVDLSDDRDIVYQGFKGAMVTGDNQLFIPHYEKSPHLYAAFRKGYIEAGQVILQERTLESKFSVVDFMNEYEEYAEDFLC